MAVLPLASTYPAEGLLCADCTSFNLRAALDYYDRSTHKVLNFGPFGDPITKTCCVLCKIARQSVGYQDRHHSQTLCIKRFQIGSLLVERLQDGIYRGAGYLMSSPNDERYWNAMEDLDEARDRLRLNLHVASTTKPSMVWYRTYDETAAVKQTQRFLRTCNSEHQSSCSSQTKSSKQKAFFVDVTQWSVVCGESRGAQPYFALSYVCGGYITLELTTKNQEEHAISGSLMSADLPQTYREAMSFTRRCGVRYLWIDFLCIMHDDKGSNQAQIEAMDQIYGKASLVLVAGLGSSPTFGLYPRSIEPQKVQGIYLHLQRNPPRDEPSAHLVDIMASTYWTRSWCFQEQFLSNRTLYFGAHWLRFQCDEMNVIGHVDGAGDLIIQDVSNIKHAVLHEEAWSMRVISRPAKEDSTVKFGDLFRAYALLVEGFSERELSFAEDIERAFAGIASVLKLVPGNVMFGSIPSILLPHALLWSPRTSTTVTRRSSTDSFASYSWTWCATSVTYWPLHENLVVRNPRSSNMTKVLVDSFTVYDSYSAQRIDVSPLNKRLCSKEALSATTNTPNPSTKTILAGSILHFQAKVVLASHFRPDKQQIEEWEAEDSGSDDNDSVGAHPFYRHGDVSKTYVGCVKGIAEGHEGCFEATATDAEKYLLVPLIAVDQLNGPATGISYHGLDGTVYLGLLVLQKTHISVRIGVVFITADAFDSYDSSLTAIDLL